jgi:predicted double-glycine peptidase
LKSNGVTKSRFLDYHAARTLPEHADEVVAEVRQAAAGKTGPQFASWCKDELRVTVSGSRANMLTQAINYVNRAAMSQAQVRFGHEGGVAKGFTWGGVRLTLPLTTLAMADFVKLPDGVEGTNCMNCRYQSQGQCWFPDLAGQEVNERTCCKFWDAPGTGRPWQQEQVKGYQWVHPGVAKGLGPHKFSTTQLDLVGDALQNVLDLQDLILPEDLAGDGKEAQPHVTVVYGLHTDDPREVQPYVRSFGPVGLTLGKVSYFPATEHSDGAEPVIIEVGGERVRDLRNVIIQAVPNTQNFPDYKPHVTLAYVRAGKGAEYAARLGGLEDLPVTITTLTFNDRSGTSTPLPLVPHAIPPERIERRKAVDPETGDPLEELPAGRKDPVKIHLPELRQGTNYSCGASALQAVCEFFGVGPQEEGAFIKLLPSDPEQGTDPSKVIALAHKLGLDVAAHQGMGIDDLKGLVDRGQPVMVLVQAWYEDYGKADLASDEDGHYVVVIGYDADNLYFADPAVKGARSELPPDEFLERWHDKGGDGRPYVRYGIAFWRPSYAEPMKGVKSNDGAGLGQSGTGDAEACTPGTIRRAGGGGGDRVAVGGPARPVARKVDGPRNLLGVK